MSESRIPWSGWNWYAEPDSQPTVQVIEPPACPSKPPKKAKKAKRVAYGFSRALDKPKKKRKPRGEQSR